MIASEPTLARLSSAQSLLLDPFGLTPDHLKKALGEIMARGADDAAPMSGPVRCQRVSSRRCRGP